MVIEGNLHKYQLLKDDCAEAAVARLRKLQPFMAYVLEEARIHEGFLSATSVRADGARKPLNDEQALHSQLAQARRGFALAGGRQSRFEAWTQYAKLVADTVKEACPLSSAHVVQEFRPSFLLRSLRRTCRFFSSSQKIRFVRLIAFRLDV